MTGADADHVAQDDEDVLLAARYGDLDDLRQMLEGDGSRLDANVTDANDNSALHLAAANGHVDTVTYLLTRCRQEMVHAHNKGGNTPLHWAALNGHLAVVKALLDFGAEPQVRNGNGRTPLDESMQNQHDDVCVAIVQSSKYKADLEDSTPELPSSFRVIETDETDESSAGPAGR